MDFAYFLEVCFVLLVLATFCVLVYKFVFKPALDEERARNAEYSRHHSRIEQLLSIVLESKKDS